jgi:hypothetical protein
MRPRPGVRWITATAWLAVLGALGVGATSMARLPPSPSKRSRALDTPVLDHVAGGGPEGGHVISLAASTTPPSTRLRVASRGWRLQVVRSRSHMDPGRPRTAGDRVVRTRGRPRERVDDLRGLLGRTVQDHRRRCAARWRRAPGPCEGAFAVAPADADTAYAIVSGMAVGGGGQQVQRSADGVARGSTFERAE